MTVWFRVDASDEIGSGHVFRCLTIADNLRQDGVRSVFLCRAFKGHLIALIQKRGYDVLVLPDQLTSVNKDDEEVVLKHSHWLHSTQRADAEAVIASLSTQVVTEQDWMFIDHFALDWCWEGFVSDHLPCRLAVIDGQADRAHQVNVLVDPNPCQPADKWDNWLVGVERTYLGFPYIPIHDVFFKRQNQVQVRESLASIFIAFGGVDREDYTALALTTVLKLPLARVIVVVGEAYPFMDQLRLLAGAHPQVELYQSIAVDQMADLMSQADLAIGAGGTMAWERCVMYLPSIVTAIADNQEKPIACLVAQGVSLSVTSVISSYQEALIDKISFLFSNLDQLKEMSLKAKQLVQSAKNFHWHHILGEVVMNEHLVKNRLGYWQIKEKPTSEALSEYYEKKYYQSNLAANQKNYSASELSLFEAKAMQRGAMIDKLLQHKKDPLLPLRLLDVGCGEGFELAFFQKKGWDVAGIDFSSDGISRHNPSLLPFFRAGNIYQLLEEEIHSGKKYNIIWLQNVLEHVIEPEALLRSLLPLMDTDGIVVVTVPNDFSALQTTLLEESMISKDFWVALPDHLSYFDAHSLKAVVEHNGWSCKAIMADFPIDWFLANSVSNYVEHKEVGKSAHHARVFLENLISKQNLDDVLAFWEALASVGMGRSITAFIQPKTH